VNLIAKLANDNDRWVCWYIYDNDFGRNKLEAYPDKEAMVVNNTRQLLILIEKSNLVKGIKE
jgi:hypothetical protein